MPTDDRLIHLVFTAQQKLRTYLKNALDMEAIRVTPAQTGILFLLKRKDGQSMTELSQLLSTDNSTITGLIDRLEKSGFVSRKVSPTDRRVFHIYLTPHGIKEINKAKTVIRRVNEEIKTGFSEQEIESFKKVLNSFFEKFNEGR